MEITENGRNKFSKFRLPTEMNGFFGQIKIAGMPMDFNGLSAAIELKIDYRYTREIFRLLLTKMTAHLSDPLEVAVL